MSTNIDVRRKKTGVIRSIDYYDPVVVYRGKKVYKLAKILTGKDELNIDHLMAVDIFYTFYLPYPLLKNPAELSDEKSILAYKIIASMLSSKHIHDIRSKSVADSLLSSIAAGIFISELESRLQKTGSGANNVAGSKNNSLPRSNEILKNTVEQALRNTRSEVDNIRKLRRVIEGHHPGTVSMMAQEEYAVELIRLARNTEVKKILELITGAKPWSINIPKRRRRSKHGEITGYELGKDLERIVASNLALPDELFYLRYLEGRLLLKQKVLTQGVGPLYVLVDKCLPGDTLVYTSDGGVNPISSLRPGDKLVSIAFHGNTLIIGFSRVVSIKFSKTRDLYIVRTAIGDLYATGKHVLTAIRDDRVVEVKTSDLNEDDKLLLLTPRHLGRECIVEERDIITLLLYALLTGGDAVFKDNAIVVRVNNKEFIENYIDLVSMIGEYCFRERSIVIRSRDLVRYIASRLQTLLVDKKKKKLPREITSLCGRSLGQYIALLFEAYGTVSSDYLVLVLPNGFLARQLRLLLLKHGVLAREIRVSDGCKLLIDLRSCARISRFFRSKRLRYVIELVDKRNNVSTRFYNNVIDGKLIAVPIHSIDYVGDGVVYDVSLEEDHRFIANGFIVHNSGSMDGVKMVWAKAVALSLYMRAVKEHREFYFRFFDSIPYPLVKLGKKPSTKQVLKLMDYIASVKGSGGTDISRALMLACNDIRLGVTRNVSEIILVTDGVDRIAEQLVLHNLKKANARLISVMIFGENRSLKRLSTKYFSVKKLGSNEILKIVEA